jgi:hypothetical protein
MYAYKPFCDFIGSVSIEMGGGTGWWCDQCGHLHKDKPVICQHQYTSQQFSLSKAKEVLINISDLSEQDIDKYLENPSQMSEAVNEYLRLENTNMEFPYLTVMDLLEDLYYDDTHDTLTQTCDSRQFKHEKRLGTPISTYDGTTLSLIHQLTKNVNKK